MNDVNSGYYYYLNIKKYKNYSKNLFSKKLGKFKLELITK